MDIPSYVIVLFVFCGSALIGMALIDPYGDRAVGNLITFVIGACAICAALILST